MILKLPDEGDTHTGTVQECGPVTGQYGEQVRFAFTDGDLLFLPYESAVRQLLRCGFDDGQDESGEDVVDFAGVAGETLTFARTHNPKKNAHPYWDISLASGAEKKPAKPSKRLTGPASPAEAPPAHHKESGVPESPDGAPVLSSPVMDPLIIETRERIEHAYRWAVDAAMRAQSGLYIGELAPTADSVQAGAATLLIQAEKRGAI